MVFSGQTAGVYALFDTGSLLDSGLGTSASLPQKSQVEFHRWDIVHSHRNDRDNCDACFIAMVQFPDPSIQHFIRSVLFGRSSSHLLLICFIQRTEQGLTSARARNNVPEFTY